MVRFFDNCVSSTEITRGNHKNAFDFVNKIAKHLLCYYNLWTPRKSGIIEITLSVVPRFPRHQKFPPGRGGKIEN